MAHLAVDRLPSPHVLRHQCAGHVLRIAHSTLAGGAAGLLAASDQPLLLTARYLLLRAQLDAVHVVEPAPVEAAKDVHATLVHDSSVEGPGRRRDTRRLHLGPHPAHEAVLVQVREAVLRLVDTSEGEHCIPAEDGRVPVARPWRRTAQGQLDPHVGGDVVLVQLLESVLAVPAAKDEHGVPIHHGRVGKATPWSRTLCHDLRPPPLTQVELPHVVEPLSPVGAAENEHRVPEETDTVVGASHGRLAQGVHRLPGARPDVVGKDIVEVVPVLLGVPPEEPDRSIPDHGLCAAPGRRRASTCADLLPEVGLQVVGVGVALASSSIGAAEEVEGPFLVHDGVACPGGVDIAQVLQRFPAAKLS
mmetsp:Transcript_108670/g.346415  ORF Transcript_108670/g.346415 Transcript_108670/m.346415 type:complete len:361 (+) Transcript_108670:1260-2342(+)